MKRIMIACIAVAAFAAPAFAEQPDGIQWPTNDNTDYSSIENLIGQNSAKIIQNGQFVSGNCNCGIDQTDSPGSRADLVLGIMGKTRGNK